MTSTKKNNLMARMMEAAIDMAWALLVTRCAETGEPVRYTRDDYARLSKETASGVWAAVVSVFEEDIIEPYNRWAEDEAKLTFKEVEAFEREWRQI